MAVTTAAHEAPVAHRTRVPLPPSLRRPGWYRAALFEVLGFAFAFGLTVLIRSLMHDHPVIDGHAITIVALLAVPIFFLLIPSLPGHVGAVHCVPPRLFARPSVLGRPRRRGPSGLFLVHLHSHAGPLLGAPQERVLGKWEKR